MLVEFLRSDFLLIYVRFISWQVNQVPDTVDRTQDIEAQNDRMPLLLLYAYVTTITLVWASLTTF